MSPKRQAVNKTKIPACHISHSVLFSGQTNGDGDTLRDIILQQTGRSCLEPDLHSCSPGVNVKLTLAFI